VNSVGQAYAILRDRRSGNKEEAQGLLDSMSPGRRKEQNRQESQARGSARKKKPYRLGERVQVKTRG
jgi:hypothetical protein